VGITAIKLVPKDNLTARSAGMPIPVNTMYSAGIMMNPPPRPSIPPANPAAMPVTSRMKILAIVMNESSPGINTLRF
jgi:hypothetical protein